MKEEKFTVEEFRNYLVSQDSFGDCLYNLSVKNIIKADEADIEEDLTEED